MEVKIEKIVGELLMQEDCVVIPNFGGFVTHYRPAILEPSKNLIIPPGKSVSFNAKLSKNDGLLAKSIAEKTHISYNDALKVIDLKVSAWFELVNKAHFLELDGIGSFILSKEGKLIFEQFNESNFANSAFGLTNVHAQAINRGGFAQKIEQGLSSKRTYPKVYQTLKRASIAAAVMGICATIGWQIASSDNVVAMNLNPLSWFKSDDIQPQPSIKAGENIAFGEKTVVSDVETAVEADTQNTESDAVDTEKAITVDVLPEPSANSGVIATDKKSNEDSNILVPEKSIKPLGKYQVIAGCFGVKENADKMLNSLQSAGFSGAQLAGFSKSGLYRVAYGTYSTRVEALKALANAKLKHSSNAWLAKK